ncbi:hypothetical protein BDF22DRAFT_741402 [Syncephalis plumigaleata]|nr:hypothetical protein BDF22DRAFT_741402 [Syncephalis plumigaleata]
MHELRQLHANQAFNKNKKVVCDIPISLELDYTRIRNKLRHTSDVKQLLRVIDHLRNNEIKLRHDLGVRERELIDAKNENEQLEEEIKVLQNNRQTRYDKHSYNSDSDTNYDDDDNDDDDGNDDNGDETRYYDSPGDVIDVSSEGDNDASRTHCENNSDSKSDVHSSFVNDIKSFPNDADTSIRVDAFISIFDIVEAQIDRPKRWWN